MSSDSRSEQHSEQHGATPYKDGQFRFFHDRVHRAVHAFDKYVVVRRAALPGQKFRAKLFVVTMDDWLDSLEVTHVGWHGMCPVLVQDIDDFTVDTYFWFEWWLEINTGLFQFFGWLGTVFDPDFEPTFPFHLSPLSGEEFYDD